MCVCVCVCVCFPSAIDFSRKIIFGDRSFHTLIESLRFIADKSEMRGSQGHSLTDKAKA